MTEEKIKKGKELLKKLNWLKDQKRRWELAQKIRKLELSLLLTMVILEQSWKSKITSLTLMT